MLKKINYLKWINTKQSILNYIYKYKDLPLDNSELTLKFKFGLFLIFISFVVGWGIPLLSFIYAIKNKTFIAPAVIGSSTYILSWGIFSLGMLLTAKKNIHYLNILIAKSFYNIYSDPLKRPTVITIVSFIFILILAALLSKLGLSGTFIYILILLFVLHQILIVVSLVFPDCQFLYRTIRGKYLHIYEPYFKCKDIILRFDDGVNHIYTPLILDILSKENIKAIFCVTGENASLYPDILKEIAKNGHIIANHTYKHPYLFSLIGYKRLKDEIVKTNKIISSITNIKPCFFAAPMGHNNIFLKLLLKKEKMLPLGWNINSYDTKIIKNRTSILLSKIIKYTKPIVILFHDGIYKYTLDNREDTVKTLKEIIPILKKENLI